MELRHQIGGRPGARALGRMGKEGAVLLRSRDIGLARSDPGFALGKGSCVALVFLSAR